MPRAEAGSTKQLSNKMKSKGLQRLRWYCQVCERQMRDENGFKCHTQSESHVRQMLLVGEDPRKYINDYSNQFQRDFLLQLRTSHGEKQININHFYQEYIANKEHTHMNATKWPSLTEFAKFLGREGICRVEDTEKGLMVAWIDNSPESLRRQDAIRKKERQDRGDEEREQKLIREQVAKAKREAELRVVEGGDEERTLRRVDGEKIKLSFGHKAASLSAAEIPTSESKLPTPPATENEEAQQAGRQSSSESKSASGEADASPAPPAEAAPAPAPAPAPEKPALKIGVGKSKNVFAAASKKNALGGRKAPIKEQPKRPMSEAERIMKEEIERKRAKDANKLGGFNAKRPRLA